jgi:thiol-disulfide isomerase/thioredoxin
MPYLVTAVIVVGALCALDLLLTLAVIRRLREHTDLLSNRASEPATTVIPPGQQVGAFSSADLDGQPVSLDGGEGPRLVAFFSPGCKPCQAMLPDFAAHAAGYPGGRARVLAVISGDDRRGADEFAEILVPVARVVFEEPKGPLAEAFQVAGFPAWCVLDEQGTVQHSGHAGDRLPAGVPA